jgi:hypothetical protein
MRGAGLTRRDAVATLLVAAAVSFYALTEAGVDVAGLDSVRMRATAVFLLGVFACGAGSASDAFTERGVLRPIVSVLTVLGLGTLVVGLAAIITGGQELLAGLVGGIVLLWFGATLRHLATPRLVKAPPTSAPSEAPRELIKR